MVDEDSRSRAGSWTVIGIALVGVGLASFAWWFHASHSKLVRRQWDAETIKAVQDAGHVTLLQIEPSATGSRTISGQRYATQRTIPLDNQPGLIHFRNALLQETTYRPTRPPVRHPAWAFVLRFTDQSLQRPVELAYSPHDRMLARGDGSHPIALGEISDRMEGYLADIVKAGDHRVPARE